MVSCLVLFPVVNPLGFKQGLYFIFSCSFIFCSDFFLSRKALGARRVENSVFLLAAMLFSALNGIVNANRTCCSCRTK